MAFCCNAVTSRARSEKQRRPELSREQAFDMQVLKPDRADDRIYAGACVESRPPVAEVRAPASALP
jgi:hypothetical protein